MKNIPEIRLKGFEGEWCYSKLENLSAFSKGQGYSKGNLNPTGNTPIILYGRMYTNYEPIITHVDTFANKKENSILSEGDEVIVPASGETAEDISIASAVVQKEVILGGDLNIIKPHKELSPSFLALSISNSKIHKELSTKAQGKSIVHLHNEDLKKVSISYPNTNEQEAISTFFQNLDNLITEQKNKLENLQKVKKSMLCKMFPKEGQKIPEIRFKGFEGDWEEKKLEEIGYMTAGGTPSTLNPKYWNGNINWLQSGAIKNCIIYQNSVIRKITKDGLSSSSAHLIRKDSVLIAITGATCANIGYLTFPCSANQSVVSVETYNNFNAMFIYQTLLNQRNQILSYKGGSAQSGISLNSLEKITIAIPAYKEQQQIANYLTAFDNQIILQNQRLKKLKQIKSALLSKMFV